MDVFFYNLLCKRKQRIFLLIYWHSYKCVHGNDTKSIIHNFFKIILYEPLSISFTPNCINLFNRKDQNLQINYSWLWNNKSHKEFVTNVYNNKHKHFKKIETNLLTDCIIPFKWRIEHRRELFKDFVLLTITHKEFGPMFENYIFVHVCQQLMLQNNVDRFVLELHDALQGRNKIETILCWYPDSKKNFFLK